MRKRGCEGQGVGGLQTAPSNHGNSIHIIAAALHQAAMPRRVRTSEKMIERTSLSLSLLDTI